MKHKSKKPDYWDAAKKTLCAKDKKLEKVILQYNGETLMSRSSAFFSLARAIVGQQISVKAADSIWTKLEAALGQVLPETVVAAIEDDLRACGLSRSKILYMKELSQFFIKNPKNKWHLQNDEEVIEMLVSIKGIGKWSAEMFLIFHLLRPDVFPIADLGLRKAIERLYNGGEKMERKPMEKLAEKWRPYRTVATWYLWRSLDPVAVEY